MRRSNFWLGIILCCTILASLAFLGDARLRGQDNTDDVVLGGSDEPYTFQLILENASVVEEYTQCSGLGSSNDVEEGIVQSDTGTLVKQKTPGPLEWHNIVLRRDSPSDLGVWNWRQAMEQGNVTQGIRSGSIIMYRKDPSELLARWDFTRGWAARLTFDGSVETLTIVHEGIARVPPEPLHPKR
jgi:phage tail-like protein